MPITADEFKHALGGFASGVTVVTTADENQLGGLTVSAFSSVSLNPPYILVCLDKRSSALPILQASQKFAVNILANDQANLSNHFASRRDDKFEGIAYYLGKLGLPLLNDALASLECTVVQEVDAGDHFIYVGQIEYSSVDSNKEPLLYYRGKYGAFGEN